MDKLRIGVMGTGRIVARWMADIAEAKGAEVVAIASRDTNRARQAAERLGISTALGSYEALVEGDLCDAVYIATPHHAHRDCAMLALNAGKHVLCEKPIAPNAAQFREMAARAKEKGLLLMEAMWTRFFPTTMELARLVQDGTIGEVRLIEASFSSCTPFETQTRMFDPAQAGGALLDVGCYGIHYAMALYGAAPVEARAAAVLGTSGVDEQAVIALRFPGDRLANINCGLRVAMPDTARLYGTAGRAEVARFWHPAGYTLLREGCSPVAVPAPAYKPEGFAYEVAHFCDCVRRGLTESPADAPRRLSRRAERHGRYPRADRRALSL